MRGELVPFSGVSVAYFVVDTMAARLAAIEDKRALAAGEARQLDTLERMRNGLREAARITFDYVYWRERFVLEQAAERNGVPLPKLLRIEGAVPRGKAWRPFPIHLASLAWAGITLLSDGLRLAHHQLPVTNGRREALLSAMLELQGTLTALVELRDGHPRLPKAAAKAEAAFLTCAKLIDNDAVVVAAAAFGAARG